MIRFGFSALLALAIGLSAAAVQVVTGSYAWGAVTLAAGCGCLWLVRRHIP